MLGSAIGVVYITASNLFKAEKLSSEEIKNYLRSTKPVLQELFEGIEDYLQKFWENSLRNVIYNAIEKYLIKTRLLVLKLERKIQSTSEWLKGRRMMLSNGQKSKYWQQISEWKSDLKNNSSSEEDSEK